MQSPKFSVKRMQTEKGNKKKQDIEIEELPQAVEEKVATRQSLVTDSMMSEQGLNNFIENTVPQTQMDRELSADEKRGMA